MPLPRRQLLSGLLFECPYHAANPHDCPLHDLRLQSLDVRAEWLDSLTEDEVERFLASHALCLAKKERT